VKLGLLPVVEFWLALVSPPSRLAGCCATLDPPPLAGSPTPPPMTAYWRRP
jgi:hypothetical protein